MAEACGRRDDARIWSFLQTLIEEFAPTLKDSGGSFDEGIFSHPLPPRAERAPSPMNTSPRGGHSELASSDDRSSSVSSVRRHNIPLDRVNPGSSIDDSDSVEELVDPPGTYSIFGTSAVSTTNRFISFAPPDDRRSSDARTSISTIVPRNSAATTGHIPGMSRDSTASSTPLRTSSPTRLAHQARSGRSRHMVASSSGSSDYPDPYGITADLGSTSRSTSSRMTTRDPSPESQKEKERGVIQLTTSSKGTRHNSRDKAQDGSGSVSQGANAIADRRRSREEEEQRRRSSQSTRGSAYPKRAEERDTSSTPKGGGGGKRLAVDMAAKNEARVYRQERCRPLLHWWKACLDQVSLFVYLCIARSVLIRYQGDVQIASTLLIVGSAVMAFPSKQSERVVHAYIGKPTTV